MQRSAEILFDDFRHHGDTDALGEVFDRMAPGLFRLALYLAPEASQAEDLVQTTFLTAIESAASYDRSRPVEPWLMGILANHARRARRQGKRRVVPELLTQREVPDPRVIAEENELGDSLHGALARLHQPYRQVLTLHLEHGLNAKQIAEVLEQSAGTVRSQVVRGMQLLRRALPAGLGLGAAALLTPGHALAGVRSEVLRHAEMHAPEVAASGLTVATTLRFLLLFVALAGATAALTIEGDVADSTPPEPLPIAAEIDSNPPPPSTAPLFEKAPVAKAEREVVAPPPATATVEITVVDTSGDPVPGYGVELMYAATRDDRELVAAMQLDPRTRVARTDDDGVARFDRLPAGRVMARPFCSVISREFELADGARFEHEFELAAVRMHRGRVLDPLGAPLAGAQIRASATRARCDTGVTVAESDQNGEFRVLVAGAGSFVWATKPGYVTSEPRRVGREVLLQVGDDGADLRGRVLGPRGEPITGAVVALVHAHVDASPETRRGAVPAYVTTDSQGKFAFEDIEPGEAVVAVRRPGFGSVAQCVDVDDEGIDDLMLRVTRAGRLRGRLTDERGRPLGGRHIMVEVPRSGSQFLDAVFRVVTCEVRADGTFDLPDVPASRVRVRVVDRYMRTWTHETRLTFQPGEIVTWNPGASIETQIRGRVIDERGLPVAGHIIAANVDTGSPRVNHYRRRHTWTRADGTFLIGGAEPGTPYRLAVHRAGVVEPGNSLTVLGGRDSVVAGPEDWTVQVPAWRAHTAHVKGSLVGPDGRPAPGATLLVRRLPMRRVARHAPDASGRFDVGPLRPGRYAIGHESARFGTAWSTPLVVDADSVDLGTLRFARPGQLRIELPDGLAQSPTLRVTSPAGHEVEPDGPIAPGRYTVVAFGELCAPTVQEVVVDAGEVTHVRLMPETGTACELRFPFELLDNVYDGTGLLHVSIETAAGTPLMSTHASEVEGSAFVMRQALREGRYKIRATSIWGGRCEQEIEVRGDGGRFELALRRG